MSYNDITLTDDDSLFRETHYARYGYERTNIFGLVTLDSRLLTYIDRPDEFPSTRYNKLPEQPVPEYTQPLLKPIRHFIAASSSELSAYITRDGYWNCLCITLGLEVGKSEVIAIDAVEATIDDKIKLFIALAVAEKIEEEEDHHHHHHYHHHNQAEESANVSYSLRIYGNTNSETKPFLEQALFEIGDSSQIIPLNDAPMQISHVQ
ncbi:MAG: hypothetical protein EXX96DRAFT_370372 [Benjaminiella poitrasii]|nr:MAG: hypothetical protein EXX96DRAFT_370372 [Benjaminiella poitrasii]